MQKESWRLFPRRLEQQINGLLYEAFPTPTRSYQIFKLCKYEGFWSGTFDGFYEKLEVFYSAPLADRSKSSFDIYLDKPMTRYAFSQFEINFRCAQIQPESVENVASWAHNMLRLYSETIYPLITKSILIQCLNKIIKPSYDEKDKDILFEDFCMAFKKTLFQLFGKKYESETEELIKKLRKLDFELKKSDQQKRIKHLIYLTQTEITWVESIKKSVQTNIEAPSFPLSKGTDKERLIEVEKVLQLYNLLLYKKVELLIKEQERIRATLMSLCEKLLEECAR